MAYPQHDTYDWFIHTFHTLSGLDLRFYKQNQMQRRIISFMNTHGYNTFPDFAEALKKNEVLYEAFFKHLTINVSQFFRDTNQWTTLREKIVPAISTGKTTLKLWSAGCSSGQEPYSLAILLTEYFPNIRFKILATDIDENVLAQAKQGFYKTPDFASTPPTLLAKYFTPAPNGYQISDRIRLSISFQKQNLLTDKFDRDFDLISCRNVVIYFTEEAKNLLYSKFVASLKPGGVLFTGSTEHLFGHHSLGLKPLSPFFYSR